MSPLFPKKYIFALLVCGCSTLPASAAISDWATSDGARMRLVALRDVNPASVTAVLQIELKPGWKTYWINPGDAGMAPQIEFSGSQNLQPMGASPTGEGILQLPVPEVGTDEGGRFIGYHKPISIVVDFYIPKDNAASVLNASAFIGVCKDICLPFQATFSLDLPADKTDPEADELITIAVAKGALPEQPSESFGVKQAKWSLKAGSLDMKIAAPGKDLPEVLVRPSAVTEFGAPTVRNDPDGFFYARIPIKDVHASDLGILTNLLIKSGNRAIQTSITATPEQASIDGKTSP